MSLHSTAPNFVPPHDTADVALLAARDLRVRLGGTLAVDGVSFIVGAGEVVGIIGPNGSGKTTALRACAGLLQAESGVIEVAGARLQQMDARSRAKQIAYLPQSSGHGMAFTALEVALMGRYPHLGRLEIEGASDHQIAMGALRRTGVGGFAARRIGDMSGGERQRVLIARALAQQPRLLLLDEPTASLDLKHQLSLMSLIRSEAAAGPGALVAIHDLGLAARYCDRLVLLQQGRAVIDGTPEQVLTADTLAEVFEVDAQITTDPSTGRPTVRLLGPLN